MDIGSSARKPRLVFFQWDHHSNGNAAAYLLLHMQQQARCLSTHFDVVVVNRDCDYAEICDRYEPEITLFESGYRSHGARQIRIANTNANPRIPKLGLHNGDPWCDRRAGFLSDMQQWGIDSYFAIGTMTPEYMPALKDSLFVWPNFIDPDVYRDYGQQKIIPVTLTGQAYGLYPWRQKVFPLISGRYPCLVSPQQGYQSTLASQLLSGEAYARVLNASFAVPACGTQGGEVVRKHFEIPGANSCLITERTTAVEAAGFVDMENCVFADERDVVRKLDHLLAHPEEMGRITAAGYDLVHSRHTLKHRPQIYQWFRLHQNLKSGERIVQQGPFGDLLKVDAASQRASAHIIGEARDRVLLKQGDILLARGRLDEAKQIYSRCLDYVSYLPEAKLRLAICALEEGNAHHAYALMVSLIEITMAEYGAANPDPVEWAYFLLTLACKGDVVQAQKLQDFYALLCHEELRRVRIVLGRTGTERNLEDTPSGCREPVRKSIHRLPQRTDAEWLAWCADILKRCGQHDVTRTIQDASLVDDSNHRASFRAKGIGWRRWLYAVIDGLIQKLHLNGLRPNVPPLPEFRYLKHFGRRLVPQSHRTAWRVLRTVFAKTSS
jgi:tetratricopeptide (TPR) repeat protein